MSVPRLLDHIVIAGPDLAELVDWFRELTGVTAAPGGTHPTGTANALVALTVNGEPRPHYLELIGPDPEREEEELPKTFSINRLKKPTLITYAVHPEGIDQVVERARAEGFDPGDVEELSRRAPDGTELTWRLTQAQAPATTASPSSSTGAPPISRASATCPRSSWSPSTGSRSTPGRSRSPTTRSGSVTGSPRSGRAAAPASC
ncbi:VOC family protein [Brachybacterium sp. Z12]|uniref:VOC family protein n=1 Tax=Brachybacterium sp. Z12 TaxID=2759167 RepID=UPI00223B1A90|nr:VOC family protein [Brachybacterium sp. Z12]